MKIGWQKYGVFLNAVMIHVFCASSNALTRVYLVAIYGHPALILLYEALD